MLVNVLNLKGISTMGSAGLLIIFATLNAAEARTARERGVRALDLDRCRRGKSAAGVAVWMHTRTAPARSTSTSCGPGSRRVGAPQPINLAAYRRHPTGLPTAEGPRPADV